MPPKRLIFLGIPALDVTVHIEPQRRALLLLKRAPLCAELSAAFFKAGLSHPASQRWRSTSRLSWDPTGSDGVQERLVVPVVLVGV